MNSNIPATIDEYIAGCPFEVQPLLHTIRQTIKEAAPMASEKISWGMATFFYHGNLVHFSSEKKHIGFHPASSAIEAFREELTDYKYSKSTIQFPYEKPLPLDLIRRIVIFRVAEQESNLQAKQKGNKAERVLRPRHEIPDYVTERLQEEDLTAQYEARPPYQRNDYIGWITKAKRPETRQKRLNQMMDELRAGNAYMGMAYQVKK